MPSFHYQWDNTNALSNTNATGQRVSYRRKSTNGPFILTGFSPANTLAVTVSSVDTANTLLENVIYEFRQEVLCSIGGPILNAAGVQSAIKFGCITPTIEFTQTTSNISLDVNGTDISSVRFTVRRQSDNTIMYGTVTVPVSGGVAVSSFSSLVPGTQYYWQIDLVTLINGVEIISSGTSYLGAACGPFSFTTTTQSNCPAVTDLTVEEGFNLDWNNIPILSNGNVISQRVLHRDRITGGNFLTTGVTPVNDLSVGASSAVVTLPVKNRVQQFKVQSVCTVGGPIDNTNGMVESISFECLPIATDNGDIEVTPTSVSYPLLVNDTDIIKARYTIRNPGTSFLVIQTCNRAINPGGPEKIACFVDGLTPETNYTIEVELCALMNGVEVYSPIELCGATEFTTTSSQTGRFGIVTGGQIPSIGDIQEGGIANADMTRISADLTPYTDPTEFFIAEPDTFPLRTIWYQNQFSTDIIGGIGNPDFRIWYLKGTVEDTTNGITYRVYCNQFAGQYNTAPLELRTF